MIRDNDISEGWRDERERSQEKRASNRERSASILEDRGIAFEVKSGGVHLIVTGRDEVIDFWPGTGKYITRSGRKGRGVFNLIKLCV